MEGSYSFDTTPIAPPGTKVLAHLKPARCKSLSFHASNGWYIGPSLIHYHCIHAIMEGTGGEHLTNTFCFKHHAMTVPIITPTVESSPPPNTLQPLSPASKSLPLMSFKPLQLSITFSLAKLPQYQFLLILNQSNHRLHFSWTSLTKNQFTFGTRLQCNSHPFIQSLFRAHHQQHAKTHSTQTCHH
jgi:hypothetical protein